jgi:hypothetical protein
VDLDFILEDVQRDLSWEQFGTKGKMDVRHITGNGDMVALKHAQKPLKHVVCQDYLLSLLLKLQG